MMLRGQSVQPDPATSGELIVSPEQPRFVRVHGGYFMRAKIVTREDDLSELAALLSTALAKARRLEVPTTAYILSMALLEVSEALKLASGDEQDDTTR
jgi:hypothetical protein